VKRRHDGLPRAAVPLAFDSDAGRYDRLVGMNPGYHKHLRLSAARLEVPDRGRGMRVLDAGCGTGASTAALVRVAPEAEIVAFDASARMLDRARGKQWPDSVRFVHTRVEDISEPEISGPFDAIFAAYLVRNVAEPDTQLHKLRGLLRPGAPMVVHEYSVRDRIAAQAVWHLMCWTVIIPLGYIANGRAGLYRHLWRSVATFDGEHAFQRRLEAAGFVDPQHETVPGWQRNIVHSFKASAPMPDGGI